MCSQVSLSANAEDIVYIEDLRLSNILSSISFPTSFIFWVSRGASPLTIEAPKVHPLVRVFSFSAQRSVGLLSLYSYYRWLRGQDEQGLD